MNQLAILFDGRVPVGGLNQNAPTQTRLRIALPLITGLSFSDLGSYRSAHRRSEDSYSKISYTRFCETGF
jgi:hypothetical protein